MSEKTYSVFESELQVRPDDIDMNNHVHNSKYFDYVLAARYDQMERFYKMPMEEFLALNYGWVINTAFVEYKRPLLLGDRFTVKTWIISIAKKDLKVGFEIYRNKTGKLCSNGWFDYTMVNTKTGRSEVIPEWIIERYAI
ncbi:acyl-CoA thioesterase [Solitalea lacus]|uniref:acyl-CoA thioesterase n=1 Tax=Solitalea lacus TaxID=2911172 RepID=UPI001EDA2D9C|nr:acyl-CoA thioesterase [Solitalea lacus]UKJ06164.1 acyl-CoA thioesterase [Solitalea lacus]